MGTGIRSRFQVACPDTNQEELSMSLLASIKRSSAGAFLATFTILSSSVFAAKGSELTGVVGISPEGPDNFFVVRLASQEGMSISGIEFYNNDPMNPVQEVYAAVAIADELPRIDSPVTQLSVGAPAEGWIPATFSEPVEIPGAVLDVYLRLPAGSVRTGTGPGGGAGIGYLEDTGSLQSFVSFGGRSCSALSTEIALAVRISYAAGKRKPQSFNQLAHTNLTLHGREPNRSADQSQSRALLSNVQVQPNPMNPHTVIQFSSDTSGSAEVSIYDSRGRLVRDWRIEEVIVGQNSLSWKGRDDRGREVASGVYLIRVQTEADVVTAKLTVLR